MTPLGKSIPKSYINLKNIIYQLDDLSKLDLEKATELSTRITESFNNHGFLIIQESKKSDCIQSLNKLKSIFWQPIYHNMSDKNGIHPILHRPGYHEYGNATNKCLGFHTDGTFEKTPPKLMIARCIRKASYGGKTKIIDGKIIYDFLSQQLNESLDSLFIDDCITVQRDDRKNSLPIFKKINNRIQVAFREGNDVQLKVNKRSLNAYNIMCNFLRNTRQSYDFYLEPHQTLVMDNTRILHARTSFKDKQRELAGLWLNADSKSRVSKSLKFGIPI